ncbi:Alpha-ketoglutarate-dependent dioxygenase AlkB [Balamuthia mandrillaris]
MQQTQITAFISRSPTKRKKEQEESDGAQASEQKRLKNKEEAVKCSSTKSHRKGKETVSEEVEEETENEASQTSCSSTTTTNAIKPTFQRKEISEGCFVSFCPDYLNPSEASELFEELLQLPNFIQGQFKMFGKPVKTPRMQSWMSDPALTASLYQRQPALPWSPRLAKLRDEMGALCGGCHFNYVLINLYRDGRDYIGFHADKEAIPEGKNKIASLSLGEPRRFLMRRYKEKKASLEYLLTPGSVILMEGETQRHWKHSVPKEPKRTRPRINLTFRIA